MRSTVPWEMLRWTSDEKWNICQLGVFVVPVLIQCCYNGQGGSKKIVHKWFFYIFYPLHLLALGLLQIYLQ